MDRKVCNICNQSKEISEFAIERKTVKGKLYEYHRCKCKQCEKDYKSKWYQENKQREKLKKQEYYEANKEKRKAQVKTYYQENKEKILAQKQEYNKKNRATINQKAKERRNQNPIVKLRSNARVRIRKALLGFTKSESTEKLIGCTWEELKSHIESLWLDNMTWDNYGDWHIDHIMPLASANSLSEIEKLCHYSNLQPLWASDNLSKGAKTE